MGCAIVNGYKWHKSKKFEISAVEGGAVARGISKEKLYQKIPALLECKRHQKPVDWLTQCEVSEFLNLPIPYFFHTETPDQKQRIFVCGEGIKCCAFCGQVADFYCDFPIGEGRTCDLPLCQEHKHHRPDIGIDIDYCPHHRR